MRPTLEDGLRALDEATEVAKTIVIELDEDYRHLIALAEALPSNQPGVDKTWVERTVQASRQYFASVVRVG